MRDEKPETAHEGQDFCRWCSPRLEARDAGPLARERLQAPVVQRINTTLRIFVRPDLYAPSDSLSFLYSISGPRVLSLAKLSQAGPMSPRYTAHSNMCSSAQACLLFGMLTYVQAVKRRLQQPTESFGLRQIVWNS